MSDYTLQVTWSTKDALSANAELKAVSATELGNEFSAILTAVNSKYDVDDKDVASGLCPLDGSVLVPVANLPTATETAAGIIEKATTAEAITGTDTDRAVTPAGIQAVLDQQGAMLERISQLADPGADRLLAWDDSATGAEAAWVTVGTGLDLTGTTLTADIGSTVQAYDAGLADIAGLAVTNGNIIVGDGANWVAENGDTARISLGVGTTDSPQFTSPYASTSIEVSHATANTITGSGGQLLIEDQYMLSHDSSNTHSTSSAKVFVSTSAPTTEGSDGDFYYEYTA